MKIIPHTTAKSSHYDQEAKHYDQFNEENSLIINQSIERILKKYRMKTVLDLTCGTGSQVFYLTQQGYEVVGADINKNMLTVAKSKNKKQQANIKFLQGDMRTLKVGQFDAVITIFNAVGHLTKKDFEKAMRNIYQNLNKNGIYIFDIFNLSYLLKDDHISRLTIDWQKKSVDKKIRTIQYSTIDEKGILASFTTHYEQKKSRQPKITTDAQTLQVYTAMQLQEMLHRSGFKLIGKYALDGSKFFENKTDRMLIVARKS